MLARSWGIQPSEFWSMHPDMFWLEYEAKLEGQKDNDSEPDWDYLLTLLDD